MKIFNELTYINNTSLALGFFDGLHLGHKVVLKNAIKIAKNNNVSSTVITFINHPLNVLYNQNIQQILTVDEKLQIFRELGVDNVVLLDFKDISHIRAKDYIENILVKYFSPVAVTTGFNHSFGYKKEGNSLLLKESATEFNFKYYEIPPFVIDGDIVSCSVIRNKLQLGNFVDANKLLGYKFFVSGDVIYGDKIASGLGFPSANIEYPADKIQIPDGVYYVQVKIDAVTYNGVLNHGHTINREGQNILKTEVHIPDFNKNIYGKNIKISFITKIRNQMQFDNTEKLIAQIKRDIGFVEIYKHFIHSN
jgi:riboflavin kinase/FMN adenylyltransferase